MTPQRAYSLLLGRFGPQGWWPVTPRGGTCPRYRPGRYGAPGGREAFEVCAGAILTQNTAWTNVEKALTALNRAGALDAARLARTPVPRLASWIRSSGYYTQKARKLRFFAGHVLGTGCLLTDWLRKRPFQPLRAELLSIHGIGPETADSILLYAGGRRAFVVDAYTKRVGSRLGWFPETAAYDEVQSFFVRRLPRSAAVYNEAHALLVAVAKAHCRKKPDCEDCPLRPGCRCARRRVP